MDVRSNVTQTPGRLQIHKLDQPAFDDLLVLLCGSGPQAVRKRNFQEAPSVESSAGASE